jgi:hypothetical protein
VGALLSVVPKNDSCVAGIWYIALQGIKNNKKYISSLNQSLTDGKQLCDNNDKHRWGYPDVSGNFITNTLIQWKTLFGITSEQNIS